MKRCLLPIRTLIFCVSAVAAALPAVAQISGSIQTTLPTGATLQGNLYPSKTQVFFTAGPQNQKASGLPDGLYYFQVTDPSGSTLLSNDPAACRQIVISGGRLAGSYDPVTQALAPAGSPSGTAHCGHAAVPPTASSANGAAAVQVGGAVRACSLGASGADILCNTPNPGGEYKLWLIAESSAVAKCNTTVNPDGLTLSFDRNCAKTDNFKTELPAVSHVAACAFNDSNGNGVRDPGELMISGWPITAAVPAASYVTLRSDSQSGTSVTATTDSTGCVSFAALGIPANTPVTVTLTEANLPSWTQTAPANGTYDVSGKPAPTGPSLVSGAVPAAGAPASGGTIAVTLGAGATVTVPDFANTDPQCPDCSILGTVTVLNTPTPQKLYSWAVSKTADKTQMDVAPGASALFNYTVSVKHDSGDRALLTGTITLINADGSHPAATLNVVDAVSDSGACTVQDPATGRYVPQVSNLTINSFAERTLPYRCEFYGSAPTAGTNTATATNLVNNAAQYTGAAGYDFSTATGIANQTVTVTDSLQGSLGTVSYTEANPHVFQYSLTFASGSAGTCTDYLNTVTLTTSSTDTIASASQYVKVCTKASPAIVTTPNPTIATLGSSTITLVDAAVLSGGKNPTGTITFTLLLGTQTVYTETVNVAGNGTYRTVGYTLPTSGAVAGTYQWNARYNGDASNNAVSESNNPAEQVAVSRVSPAFTVSYTLRGGDGPQLIRNYPIAVNATLSGGNNPTGKITFTLHNYTENKVVCSVVLTVNGNGTYSTPGCRENQADEYYYYDVTYSGDDYNNSKQESSYRYYAAS